MRSLARALGALFVIGTLTVPYVQPVLCDQLMPAAMPMDGHAPHDGQRTPTTQIGSPDAGVPCVPTCVATHAAPLPCPLTEAYAAPDRSVLDLDAPQFLSVVFTATPPPPRS